MPTPHLNIIVLKCCKISHNNIRKKNTWLETVSVPGGGELNVDNVWYVQSFDLVADPRTMQGLGRGKRPSCRLKRHTSPMSDG